MTTQTWSHRDLLRLSHPKTDNPAHRAMFNFVCDREPDPEDAPFLIEGFMRAQMSPSPQATAEIMATYRLPWEALKPEHLTDPQVWAALLDNGMPQTALMRNLPRLTNLGLLARGGGRQSGKARTAQVAEQLATGMSRAKVHPVNVLVALRTYASGRSVQGSSSWAPVPQIVDALDAGFYEAFGGVEPAGKRTLLALDVSGSMTALAGGLPISCREVSAALAMVTVATEPDVQVVGFTAGGGDRYGWSWRREAALTPLDISPRRRLDDVVRSISGLPFGGTDCALPWTWALENGLEFDTIVTMTDNETWAGSIHPHQAMHRYRESTGIPARSVVLGMTSTGFSINPPDDALGLDIAGMDSAVPSLIADFSAGRL